MKIRESSPPVSGKGRGKHNHVKKYPGIYKYLRDFSITKAFVGRETTRTASDFQEEWLPISFFSDVSVSFKNRKKKKKPKGIAKGYSLKTQQSTTFIDKIIEHFPFPTPFHHINKVPI